MERCDGSSVGMTGNVSCTAKNDSRSCIGVCRVGLLVDGTENRTE